MPDTNFVYFHRKKLDFFLRQAVINTPILNIVLSFIPLQFILREDKNILFKKSQWSVFEGFVVPL